MLVVGAIEYAPSERDVRLAVVCLPLELVVVRDVGNPKRCCLV